MGNLPQKTSESRSVELAADSTSSRDAVRLAGGLENRIEGTRVSANVGTGERDSDQARRGTFRAMKKERAIEL